MNGRQPDEPRILGLFTGLIEVSDDFDAPLPDEDSFGAKKRMNMKAIETVYRGYRFRSRLEARWAVFFDVLEMPWKYEVEGYDLDGIWYLPDFWLPKFFGGSFLEVKPQMPNKDDSKKLFSLADYKNIFVAVGDPMTKQGLFCVLRSSFAFLRFAYKEATRQVCLLDEDPKEAWLLCDSFNRNETFEKRNWPVELTNNMVLMKAYATARQARFEHGGNFEIKYDG